MKKIITCEKCLGNLEKLWIICPYGGEKVEGIKITIHHHCPEFDPSVHFSTLGIFQRPKFEKNLAYF